MDFRAKPLIFRKTFVISRFGLGHKDLKGEKNRIKGKPKMKNTAYNNIYSLWRQSAEKEHCNS